MTSFNNTFAALDGSEDMPTPWQFHKLKPIVPLKKSKKTRAKASIDRSDSSSSSADPNATGVDTETNNMNNIASDNEASDSWLSNASIQSIAGTSQNQENAGATGEEEESSTSSPILAASSSSVDGTDTTRASTPPDAFVAMDSYQQAIYDIDIDAIPPPPPPRYGARRPRYGEPHRPWTQRSKKTTPFVEVARKGGKVPVSSDFEFQRYRPATAPGEQPAKWRHRIGKATAYDTGMDLMFDMYVKYDRVKGVAFRLDDERFGVEPEDLEEGNGAVRARKAEKMLKKFYSNRIVVLFGGTQDLRVFFHETDALSPANGVTIVDMQKEYSYLQRDGTPSLETVARHVFGDSTLFRAGTNNHDSLDDARMTMELYLHKLPHMRTEPTGETKVIRKTKQTHKTAKRNIRKGEPTLSAPTSIGAVATFKQKFGSQKQRKAQLHSHSQAGASM